MPAQRDSDQMASACELCSAHTRQPSRLVAQSTSVHRAPSMCQAPCCLQGAQSPGGTPQQGGGGAYRQPQSVCRDPQATPRGARRPGKGVSSRGTARANADLQRGRLLRKLLGASRGLEGRQDERLKAGSWGAMHGLPRRVDLTTHAAEATQTLIFHQDLEPGNRSPRWR